MGKELEGDPAHRPPFGDLWSHKWRWRLSYVAVAGTPHDRHQRRDAEGGDDKCEHSAEIGKSSSADDCVTTCQNKLESLGRTRLTESSRCAYKRRRPPLPTLRALSWRFLPTRNSRIFSARAACHSRGKYRFRSSGDKLPAAHVEGTLSMDESTAR